MFIEYSRIFESFSSQVVKYLLSRKVTIVHVVHVPSRYKITKKINISNKLNGIRKFGFYIKIYTYHNKIVASFFKATITLSSNKQSLQLRKIFSIT